MQRGAAVNEGEGLSYGGMLGSDQKCSQHANSLLLIKKGIVLPEAQRSRGPASQAAYM